VKRETKKTGDIVAVKGVRFIGITGSKTASDRRRVPLHDFVVLTRYPFFTAPRYLA
jgi:hypothetical protein